MILVSVLIKLVIIINIIFDVNFKIEREKKDLENKSTMYSSACWRDIDRRNEASGIIKISQDK